MGSYCSAGEVQSDFWEGRPGPSVVKAKRSGRAVLSPLRTETLARRMLARERTALPGEGQCDTVITVTSVEGRGRGSPLCLWPSGRGRPSPQPRPALSWAGQGAVETPTKALCDTEGKRPGLDTQEWAEGQAGFGRVGLRCFQQLRPRCKPSLGLGGPPRPSQTPGAARKASR